MDVSIIIVNYNTADLLARCLRSLFSVLSKDKTIKTEVIVVDNGSHDDSCEMVKKKFPSVILLPQKTNLGFAKANNIGILHAKGSYILLLNSDTEVISSAVSHLLSVIKSSPDIAVVGGKVLNMDKTVQPSVGFAPHLFRIFLWMSFLDDICTSLGLFHSPYHVEQESFYDHAHDVDWVTGACFLTKKSIFQEVGMLPDDIFMYAEEVEWCYRVRTHGWRVVYTPFAVIYHQKGASGEGKTAGIIQELQSLKVFYKKHKPVWQRPFLSGILWLGVLLRMILFGIIKRNRQKAHVYAKALQMV